MSTGVLAAPRIMAASKRSEFMLKIFKVLVILNGKTVLAQNKKRFLGHKDFNSFSLKV